MEAFRESLRIRGLPDIRSAVLDDLSSYFNLDAEACIYRARNSFEPSSKQWLTKDRSTEKAITDFYLHLSPEYALGILWYTTCRRRVTSIRCVVIARDLASSISRDLASMRKGRLLDFGSGVGATGQMFGLLGYGVSLADVSTPLLDFARYRFSRRGQRAGFIDLNQTPVERNAYRVITAVNTLAHVPNILKTAQLLHAALLPGATISDIHVGPRHRGAQRLYSEDLLVKKSHSPQRIRARESAR
jgi:SAM-dependent methyltransferase